MKGTPIHTCTSMFLWVRYDAFNPNDAVLDTAMLQLKHNIYHVRPLIIATRLYIDTGNTDYFA